MNFRYLYGQSDGRIGARDYFRGLAILVLVAVLPLFLRPMLWIVGPIWLWCFVCLVSKRLHDFGRPGPWMLLLLPATLAVGLLAGMAPVRLLGFAVPVAFLFGALAWIGTRPGDPAENRFGPPPA